MPREQKIELKLSPERSAGLERISRNPMAMRPDAMETLMTRIVMMEDFDEPPELEAAIIEQAPSAVEEAKVPRLPKTQGGVAVVPVFGTIAQHRGSDYWGGIFTEELVPLLGKLVDMPNIGAVVLSFDSPGGIVFGVEEAARSIREMSQRKAIYGHVKAESASASYWLSANTTKLFAAPSAQVGSIGVWSLHADTSEAWKKFGVNISLISAGKYKTENNPFEPLTKEGRAEMQQSVDRYYEDFLAGVAEGRGVAKGVVKSDFGEGRMLSADRAKSVGMIDGIATLDELLAGIMLPKGGNGDGGRRASYGAKISLAAAWDPAIDS